MLSDCEKGNEVRLKLWYKRSMRGFLFGTKRVSKLDLALALLVVLLLSVAAVVCGISHDYKNYVHLWTRVSEGANPWHRNLKNSHGPVHVIFMYANYINVFAPRIIFVISWAITSFMVYAHINTIKILNEIEKIFLFSILFLSPTFIVFTVGLGTNDAVTIMFTMIALFALLKGKEYYSGLFLSLGVMHKIIPIVLVPIFLVRSNLRIRWKFGLAFLTSMAFGIGISYYIWGGEGTFSTANDRGKKI
ncbi:TPA: hypothetical protein DE059_00675 [Candidatus Peribacteria bacterium]|nr:hypothetical protein [Candidatus Peribacteria bacterium]|tara:strand:- start:2256 stop:2996 length:741 start_codon:yes stop_codon:yes gene_type:complete